MTAQPTVLFVGESPPLGAPEGFRPFDCPSGDRVARLMGMRSRAVLLDHVPRCNIFDTPGVGVRGGPAWDDEEAAMRGSRIVVGLSNANQRQTIVTLGRKPHAAMGITGSPSWGTWRSLGSCDIVIAPHPSGQSISLNGEAPRVDFRRYLLPEVVLGCPTLRPWHFHLDNPDVLRDLGAAISPHDVALGIAALCVSDEVHRALAVPRGSRHSLEHHRVTVDVSMRLLAIACVMGPDAVAGRLSWWPALGEHINAKAMAQELRSRARAASKDDAVRDYPVSVLRATIGRHAAKGVT